jgi:hypothetical protein
LYRPPSPLSLLHGRDIQSREEFSKIANHTGLVIDAKIFGADAVLPRGLSLAWIRVNPDIYTFLIDRKSRKPAGYLNAMPVEDTLYLGLRSGDVTDKEVTADNVLPYIGSQSILKVYLMSIAIAEEYRRWGDGIFQQGYVQLLNGFLDNLTYYAKHHHVRVTHFLATAWTPEGHRICKSFGMDEVGKDRDGHCILELDVSRCQKMPSEKLIPALRRLIRLYANA